MEDKKKKRTIRDKKDTIIKWVQLANTMYLSNEEFGALIRKTMIDDDQKGLRYENLDEETLKEFLEYENQWSEDYKRLRKINPLVGAANTTIGTQVKTSTKRFNDLKNRIENNFNNDNDDNDDEQEESAKPKQETPVKTTKKEEPKKQVAYDEFWFEGYQVALEQSAVEKIKDAGEDVETISFYIERNKEKYEKLSPKLMEVVISDFFDDYIEKKI